MTTLPKSGASASAAGRPRSEEAHQAILDATINLLSEIGYDRLTIAGVAARAGVGKATIYRRWSSKLPLVIESFAQLPLLPEPDTGVLIDDLTDILRSFAEVVQVTPFASLVAILAGECTHDPEMSALLAPHIIQRRAPVINVLSRAVARNELPPDIDLEAAADMVMGPLVNRAFFTHDEINPDEMRPQVEAVLYGITRLRKSLTD